MWAAEKPPTGTCYRVLLWESGAVPPDGMAQWRQERTVLMQHMQEAGLKGSRGRLGQLSSQLEELAVKCIKAPLATCPRGGFSHARVSALADCLRSDASVLAFRLGAADAEILMEPTGEEAPDETISRWQNAVPGMEWESTAVTFALCPREAVAWQASCRCAPSEQDIPEEEKACEGQPFHHLTVMAQEAADALLPAEGKIAVDATLGGGGHSELLLKSGMEVWGVDQDPAARAAARQRLASYGDRLHILAGNFRDLASLLQQHGVGQVDALLADIGVSSPQVDQAERGFSFLHDGPLDMRMNPSATRTAAHIVNTAGEEELADILWQYGEERASRAIARRIVQERQQSPVTTTAQLAGIISRVLPRKGKQHPATRSFQALRIAVNDELGALDELLRSGLGLLKRGGRFAVITFHSLEDRAVKRYFDRVSKPEIDRPEWPQPRPNPEYAARLVFRKPLTPGEAELLANPRSRSAKLRVIEKL